MKTRQDLFLCTWGRGRTKRLSELLFSLSEGGVSNYILPINPSCPSFLLTFPLNPTFLGYKCLMDFVPRTEIQPKVFVSGTVLTYTRDRVVPVLPPSGQSLPDPSLHQSRPQPESDRASLEASSFAWCLNQRRTLFGPPVKHWSVLPMNYRRPTEPPLRWGRGVDLRNPRHTGEEVLT